MKIQYIKRYQAIFSSMQRHSVFSLSPTRFFVKPITMQEIHDCVDSTRRMPREDRISYMQTLGIDYDKVERYGPIVERLNRQIEIMDNDDIIKLHHHIKLHHVVAFCVSFVLRGF